MSITAIIRTVVHTSTATGMTGMMKTSLLLGSDSIQHVNKVIMYFRLSCMHNTFSNKFSNSAREQKL